MESRKDTFEYTYSAKQQEEIRKIRQKYLPQEDKMEQLRKLDRGATKKGTVLSVTVGIVGCLLLGVGMCCTMVWMDRLFVPGISPVQPDHQAGAGKIGPTDFKAHGGAVKAGLTGCLLQMQVS